MFKEQPLINMQNKTITLLNTNSIKRDFVDLGFSKNFTELLINCFEINPIKRTTSEDLYNSLFKN